ncbi:exodeoxyribonuclease V subunit beta [Lacimicrobium sp. SS2-24]|uniref:exodeoxyribonuclease V subunit beta n=1 Tax=Lacimicrobium sp. SS2-24 TaxID=2005569 RepID=UPI000B4B55E5|nr:exodeoxyribonuclease V subunit beta [Lacimicrobium sp. SS2-24]
MKPLDLSGFPLSGQSLIEASAGTGKTFTIVHLYLRLLIGHQCAPLKVDQILVVTFTNAATAELKHRIRSLIHRCSVDFYAGKSDDSLIQRLIDEVEEPQQAFQRLQLASRQMDEAAIFTIHSFCQRALVQHAFESGERYQQELILDESEHLNLAVKDFWRSEIAPLPAPLLELVLSFWGEPAALQQKLRPLLSQSVQAEEPDEDPQQLFCRYRQCLQQTRDWWLQEQVAEQLLQAGLKKNTLLGKGEVIYRLDDFFRSEEVFFSGHKDGWQVLFPHKVQSAATKTSKDLSHLNFGPFELLHKLEGELRQALQVSLSLKALAEVRQRLSNNKDQANQLSPDDLLRHLQRALGSRQGADLASAIRNQYPAALIDEFQDTDATQFEIFSTLYPPQGQHCLIMIGDPKQAIYAFRGADIFTYIQAKRLVDEQRRFTLDTNWRSRHELVEGVNHLFAQSRDGFLFNRDIPFMPVKAADKQARLLVQGQPRAGICFNYLATEDPKALSVVQSPLVQDCVNQIAGLLQLAEQGEAVIQAKDQQRPLQPGDCAVLVRDKIEADMIRTGLRKANIDSVFLVRRSVFSTQLARDLYILLKAIHNPADERLVKAAMLTEMVGLDAAQFEQWLLDELRWQDLLWQFFHWQKLWQRQGIASALAQMLDSLEIQVSLMRRFEDGMRQLTDLRHLLELLQQQEQQHRGESQLLRWYHQILLEPDDNHEAQQLRLETDDKLVQIVTMHASKGLEYPLVFIPFACKYSATKEALYHDDENRLRVDFTNADSALERAAYERLAEDIRLFYVALTRAEHYCSLGVWHPNTGGNTKASGLLQTALGNLVIGGTENLHSTILADKLDALADGVNIQYRLIEPSSPVSLNRQANQQEQQLSCAVAGNSHYQRWRLTSYSAISQQQDKLPAPGYDEAPITVMPPLPEMHSEQDNRFSFPRGARPGSFLHDVLEHALQPDSPPLAELVEAQAMRYGIESRWWPVVSSWLSDAMQTPFVEAGLCLNNLEQLLAEMEFHLPVNQIKASAFNAVLNRYRSDLNAHYDFETLNGALKGYVDLIFMYQGKVYVADYKSNHLGDSFADYNTEAMGRAMQEHDYELQAILYSLALHRWLQSRLEDYDYDRHVGGACYLFLRGMTAEQIDSGCYFTRPQKELIMALDKLFRGHSRDDNQMEQLELC